MADSDEPKKRAGRPLKKKRGTSKAQNVPGEKEQKAVREKGRKRKNYLAKKGVCGGFDPGDDGDKGGGTGVHTGSKSFPHSPSPLSSFRPFRPCDPGNDDFFYF